MDRTGPGEIDPNRRPERRDLNRANAGRDPVLLTEHFRELLTSYVDGELSARERNELIRLLQRSGEARRLLRQLQRDSKALRKLPLASPTINLSDSVLQTIHGLQLPPIPSTPPRTEGEGTAPVPPPTPNPIPQPRTNRVQPSKASVQPMPSRYPLWLGLVAVVVVFVVVCLGSFLMFL